ncbi:omega-3 fatty acid desaturase [Forsythia ovata]|uniref:Omega-3 fatty acid desaturase n=1 Tax=Forsythia ovata TaxID=205694 RepID=A0ABD1UC50_9LAMI
MGASPTTPISIILWDISCILPFSYCTMDGESATGLNHEKHGHVEIDESWVLLPEKIYMKLDLSSKFMRYKIPFPLFAYPMYLRYRSPGKKNLHFNPYSELFKSSER